MIAIDTRDFCIPSDENDYDELVAFADTIAGIQTHEVIPIDVLNKIRAEIDEQYKWLLKAGYTAYNVDIAFGAIKAALRNEVSK